MNRKERRAAEAAARRAEVEPGTAYHEAGHAIARLLTATAMGYEPEEAVHSIEVNPGSSGRSRDGRMHLISQAICMGPMVSKPFELAVRQAINVNRGMSAKVLWEGFATHGTDEDRRISMRSRMLIDVMGAAAESRYLGKSAPAPLFSTHACEDDREDFARNCRVLGIAASDMGELEAEFLKHAQMLVERPIIWSAIEAIAKRLRATMPGRQVWQLAWPFLSTEIAAIDRILPGQ